MRVFVIAGEPSGDRLGGALMAGLKELVPEISFDGIGGPLMTEQGLQSRFPMDELSVMGLAEVLPKYFHLKRRIAETAQAVIDSEPDLLITIDSPDFCLRVAALVKAETTTRTVHYVAPTVWAWRPHRAEKMARVIDHVLALFPFEPPYMEAAGMDCDFVGHPVATEPQAGLADVARFRALYDLGNDPIALVLPGSRRGEVSRLSPIFGAALERVAARNPALRFVVPSAAPVASLVRAEVAAWKVPAVVLDPRDHDAEAAKSHKRAAFAAADMALAASGTVSLELAAAQTPMVVAYTFNWLTRQIIGRMLLTDTVTLVNLVSDTRSVPECLGADCRADRIAACVDNVLTDPSTQEAAMKLTMERLGRGGDPPGLRAARAILKRLPEQGGSG